MIKTDTMEEQIQIVKTINLEKLSDFIRNMNKVFTVKQVRVCDAFDTPQGHVNGTYTGYQLENNKAQIGSQYYEVIPLEFTRFEIYYETIEIIEL